MPVAVGRVFKIRIYAWNPNTTQVSINTIYQKITTIVGAAPTVGSWASLFDAAIAPFAKSVMPTNVDYVGTDYQDISSTPYPTPHGVTTNAGAGTYADANVNANQVSGLISLRTGLAGPHYRGRIYLGFTPASSQNAAGQMVAAYEVVGNLYAQFLQNAITVGVAPAVTSETVVRSQLPILPIPPLPPFFNTDYNTVVRAFCPRKFATQRRRGQFGRINPRPLA